MSCQKSFASSSPELTRGDTPPKGGGATGLPTTPTLPVGIRRSPSHRVWHGPRPTGFGMAGSGTQGPLPPRVQSRTSCQARPPPVQGTSPGARPLVPVSGPSSSRGSSEASKYRALSTVGAADPVSPLPPPPPRPRPRGTQAQLPPPPGPTPGSSLRSAPASPRLRPELPAHSALTLYAPPTRPTPQTYSKTCSEVQIFMVPAACAVSGRR